MGKFSKYDSDELKAELEERGDWSSEYLVEDIPDELWVFLKAHGAASPQVVKDWVWQVRGVIA
jgi:hypothetical protein